MQSYDGTGSEGHTSKKESNEEGTLEACWY